MGLSKLTHEMHPCHDKTLFYILLLAYHTTAVDIPTRVKITGGLTAGTHSMVDIDTACKASGYCSLETSPSHYVGPLRSNLELKAALRGLGFKKEIILTSESRMDPAAQFFASFQRAGYGHVLMMTESELMCSHLASVFLKIGCGWNPAPSLYDDKLSNMFPLKSQYPKLFMGARIIRHGYNVMIVDSGKAVFIQQ